MLEQPEITCPVCAEKINVGLPECPNCGASMVALQSDKALAVAEAPQPAPGAATLDQAARYLFETLRTKLAEGEFDEAAKVVDALRALAPDFEEPNRLLEQARQAAVAGEKRAQLERLTSEFAAKSQRVQALQANLEAIQVELRGQQAECEALEREIAKLSGQTANSEPVHLPKTDSGTLLSTLASPKARLIVRSVLEHRRFLQHVIVEDALFTPDGKGCVTFADDKTVRIWDLPPGLPALGETLRLDEIPTFAARETAGRYLAVGDLAGKVTIWEPGRPFGLKAMVQVPNEVTSLAFSASGAELGIGSLAGDFFIAKLPNKPRLTEFHGTPVKLSGVDDDLDALGFSPDQRYLACGTSDGRVKLFATTHYELLAERQLGSNPSLVFDAKSTFLVCGDSAGMITLLNLPDLSVLQSYRLNDPDAVCRLALSPENELLAVSTLHGAIFLFSTGDGKVLSVAYEHKAAIFGLDFHPSGRRLLTASSDGRAILWKVQS